MNDSQVREFIEKCLVPASERLSAEELLKYPFLQLENLKDSGRDLLQLPSQTLKAVDKSGPLSMDIDADYKQVSTSTCSKVINGGPHCPVLEFQRTNKNNEFRLKGMINDNDSVALTLRIADVCGE